jgi:hypothetical protein
MVVTLAAFAICGAFLLAGATFFPETEAVAAPATTAAHDPGDARARLPPDPL